MIAADWQGAMMTPISRRSLLRLSPLAFSSCRKSKPYFGSAGPPSKQRVIYAIGSEPSNEPTYSGVIESGTGADYADPNAFFEFFTGQYDESGRRDSEFNRIVDAANAADDPVGRMATLARYEEHLLREMPVSPLFFDSNSSLLKPYVRGMRSNALDIPQFRSAWIDTNWGRS